MNGTGIILFYLFMLAVTNVAPALFFSGCATADRIASKAVAGATNEVIHDSHSFRSLEKRVDLLEVGEGHTRSEMEVMGNSFHLTNKIMDSRLARIEKTLDDKLERIISIEEKILEILKDRRTSYLKGE